MLKLIGSILVLAGCIGTGLMQIRRMNRRIHILHSLSEGLELLGYELEFRMSALAEVLISVSCKVSEPVSSLFRTCAEEMELNSGRTFDTIWSDMVQGSFSCLKQADLDQLCSIGKVLGRYDMESQLCTINGTVKQLNRCVDDALIEKRGQGKVCGALSAAVGAFLVIILL